MMNSNAMNNRRLSVVSVRGGLGVDYTFYDAPKSASRRTMRSERWKLLCGEVVARWELFNGRFAGMGNASGT